MFPYQRKKRSISKRVTTNISNHILKVESFYFDVYDRIENLVIKQNYKAPQGYTKKQWRSVMINLQCKAYLKLKQLLEVGILGKNQLSELQLSSLKGYSSDNDEIVDWHQIYMKQQDILVP